MVKFYNFWFDQNYGKNYEFCSICTLNSYFYKNIGQVVHLNLIDTVYLNDQNHGCNRIYLQDFRDS